jgi:hypothetical protein
MAIVSEERFTDETLATVRDRVRPLREHSWRARHQANSTAAQLANNAQQNPIHSLSGEAIDRKDDLTLERPSMLQYKASVNLSHCSHRGKHAITLRKIPFNKFEALR